MLMKESKISSGSLEPFAETLDAPEGVIREDNQVASSMLVVYTRPWVDHHKQFFNGRIKLDTSVCFQAGTLLWNTRYYTYQSFTVV